MEFTLVVLLLSFMVLSCLYLFKRNFRHKKLPPGPYPFPIIGNIHQLIGKHPHRLFAELAKTYGPLMSMRLGTIFTVVVSSPEMAKEILQKHDHVFSGRGTIAASQALDHDKFFVGFLQVGKTWTNLRKILKEHMFSSQRLNASEVLRQEKLQQLFEYLQKCCMDGRAVNICEASLTSSLNLMSTTLFSLDITGFESHNTNELKDSIDGFVHTLGIPNVADFFPILQMLDPQGIKKKAEFFVGKVHHLFDTIINERLETRGKGPKKQDMLETLLDLYQTEGSGCYLSPKDIKYLLLDLFVAGSESTAISMEWVMTELIINPEKMSKVQNELRTVLGKDKKVEESDISRLPYLRAVVKETFRLHPPAPLLVPHKASAEVEINGYTIPKDTQILINVWAMGRLSSVWSNVDSFEPERFLDSKIDYKGQDFELLPFGAGRRMCPGLPMAQRALHLTLATFLHNFDWKLEPGMKKEDVNTDEKFGIGLPKAVPLKCIPVLKPEA